MISGRVNFDEIASSTLPLVDHLAPDDGDVGPAGELPAPERSVPALGEEGGGVGPWEAGDPHGPHHRLRVGSQGGMPTRSSPEAGLAGDELLEERTLNPSPCEPNTHSSLSVK